MNRPSGPSNSFTTPVTAGVPTEGVAVTGVNTYYGTPVDLDLFPDASWTLHWTGTPTGVFTVWVTNKPVPSLADDTDWVALTLAVAIVQPAGAAGKDYLDLAGLPFGWVRLKYVNASGSGTVNAYPRGKGA